MEGAIWLTDITLVGQMPLQRCDIAMDASVSPATPGTVGREPMMLFPNSSDSVSILTGSSSEYTTEILL